MTFDRLMTGLLFLAIVATACLMPSQSDTFWHLRAGQDFWRTLHVPLVETYSHTAAGSFWPNHEWLWQAVSYVLVRAGGMPTLQLFAALVVTSAFVLAYRLSTGATSTRFLLMILGLPVCSCVWALRPQIVSLALLVLLVTLLARDRLRWVLPLFVVWANVHGAVALGGVVLAVAAGLALYRARSGDPIDRRRAAILAALVPLCAASTALTPLGPRLWMFIIESIGRSRRTMIMEWMPAYPKGPVEIAFWVLALAFAVLFVVRRRRLRAWSDVVVVGAAIVLLALAIRAVRNIPPFLLLAIPAASRLLGEDFRLPARKGAADSVSADRPRINLALLSGLGLFAAATIAFAWATRLPMLGWDPLPPRVVGALRACPGPLYNRYNDGGYVIWFVPERPVFVDSRQDPYPLDFVLEAIASDNHATPDALIARYHIGCALLPSDSRTLPHLLGQGWRVSAADEPWSVLVPAR